MVSNVQISLKYGSWVVFSCYEVSEVIRGSCPDGKKPSVSREVPDQFSMLSKPLVSLWGSFCAFHVNIIKLHMKWVAFLGVKT